MKNKKLINSFKYAFSGIFSAFKTERNMKIHASVILLVIIFGIILNISKTEWLICTIWFAVVIAGELFNTAIELAVDLAMPDINPKAKLSKDISAGGVLVMAIGSIIVGLTIFLPKIVEIMR